MARVLAIFLLLAISYLFYPFWDLYVRKDPFSTVYTEAGKGYWTRAACVEAAVALKNYDFRCRKRTNLSVFLGTSSDYARHGLEE